MIEADRRKLDRRRALAALGIAATGVAAAFGDAQFESGGSGTAVYLTPTSLAAWPLQAAAVVAALQAPGGSAKDRAAWWRRACAFVADFATLLSVVGVPFCLLALVLETGTLPPPWQFERAGTQPSDWLLTLLFVPVFVGFWAGLGLAFHPRVSSPGALVFGVALDAGRPVPTWRLAVFGVFAYYGVVMPLFRAFAWGLEPRAWRRT